MANTNLTPKRLKELLHYDEVTGIFTWKIRRGGTANVGDIAGSMDKFGYSIISLNNKLLRAHRLAWLYVHGRWPINDIDHIDGDKSNNRISNLREATPSENMQNMRKARSVSKTGLLGVSWDKSRNKFRSQIGINYKNRHIGYFATAELAQTAYLEAKRRHHQFAIMELKQ